MKRRSFLTALAGMFVAPNLAKALPLPKELPQRISRARYDVQAIRDKNVLLRINDYAGLPVVNFRGIPIKIIG
jgi:hypothetical protein